MELAARLFNKIARSHMYWGRKPLAGLLQLFEEAKGEVVLDPFCGAGTPAVAALVKKARVIATDLNPMSILLTKVLIRPLSIPGVTAAFYGVYNEVLEKIGSIYRAPCPTCKKPSTIDYLLWEEDKIRGGPTSAQVECPSCGRSGFHQLKTSERKRQLRMSQTNPVRWYPTKQIQISYVSRKPPVPSYDKMFTRRNLFVLSELFNTIQGIEVPIYREALQYVFTALLYSCSQMQMFSDKQPSSSRGWTALRFYIPAKRKESNVLKAFSRRFNTFLTCKKEMNDILPNARVTEKDNLFKQGEADILLKNIGWRDSLNSFGSLANHVFLDPPYNEDVDYFGFSEFWGSWLSMRFDFKSELRPRWRKGANTKDLLSSVARITAPRSRVILVLDPKNPTGWDTKAVINSSGYRIAKEGYFLYDHSNKRGNDLLRRRENYYVLETKSAGYTADNYRETANKQEVYPYLRAMAFRLSGLNPGLEMLRTRTSNELLPHHLQYSGGQLSAKEIKKETKYPKRNRQTYHSLCLALISILLIKDKWELTYINDKEVEYDAFGCSHHKKDGIRNQRNVREVFAFKKANRRLLFFFEDQKERLLKTSAKKVHIKDNNRFETVVVLILRSNDVMTGWRMVHRADDWPRGFFISFDELRDRCAQVELEKYSRVCSIIRRTMEGEIQNNQISQLSAKVISNVQVGGEEAPHYKLRFEISHFAGIFPGQFITMETTQSSSRKQVHSKGLISWKTLKSSFSHAPQTYLKRPFGIHRTFYPHFRKDYLKKLVLPRSLSLVMHTVFPNSFDIFYKVLPYGKGTREMRQLRRGMKVKMFGPLGKRIDIRKMLNEGVEEVHVIGGGVGMAPLISLVQSLRYFEVPVKAFIGIESISLLKYQEVQTSESDSIYEGFAAGAKDAHIYVDDLQEAGVDKKDIFLSCDNESDVNNLVLQPNYFTGFVSKQYEKSLSLQPEGKDIIAFACGPMPMMEAVYKVARTHGIRLLILMEKRMACGIGVCLSCVCKTTTSPSGYSRVCKDGPIFEASEIVWK